MKLRKGAFTLALNLNIHSQNFILEMESLRKAFLERTGFTLAAGRLREMAPRRVSGVPATAAC